MLLNPAAILVISVMLGTTTAFVAPCPRLGHTSHIVATQMSSLSGDLSSLPEPIRIAIRKQVAISPAFIKVATSPATIILDQPGHKFQGDMMDEEKARPHPSSSIRVNGGWSTPLVSTTWFLLLTLVTSLLAGSVPEVSSSLTTALSTDQSLKRVMEVMPSVVETPLLSTLDSAQIANDADALNWIIGFS